MANRIPANQEQKPGPTPGRTRSLRLAGLVGLIILGYGMLPFVSDRNATAVARVLNGAVECKERSGPWKPVTLGQAFGAGMSLRTGPKSQVDLWLRENQCVLRVQADSELGFDRLAEENSASSGDKNRAMTSLYLQRGAVNGHDQDDWALAEQIIRG